MDTSRKVSVVSFVLYVPRIVLQSVEEETSPSLNFNTNGPLFSGCMAVESGNVASCHTQSFCCNSTRGDGGVSVGALAFSVSIGTMKK